MDAITQGLLGGAVAQVIMQKRLGNKALWAGALAGMAADLDVFIYSSSNPMLGVTYHRHFTHSLAFIPVGAAVIALLLGIFRSYRKDWIGVYWACLWGYATHGLLDACTSYGTMLLWPFSHTRVAWDCIAIVDPIFTAALLLGVIFAQRSGRSRYAAIALVFCLAYLGFGEVQNRRGELAQRELAMRRGSTPVKGRVMPTLGNLSTWRSVYEAEGQLWADAIHLPPFGTPQIREGAQVSLFTENDLPPGFLANPSLRRDWERFYWFSEGFLARDSSSEIIADMRYSSETQAFKPLWGIILPATPDAAHVGWTYFRVNRKQALQRLWQNLKP